VIPPLPLSPKHPEDLVHQVPRLLLESPAIQ